MPSARRSKEYYEQVRAQESAEETKKRRRPSKAQEVPPTRRYTAGDVAEAIAASTAAPLKGEAGAPADSPLGQEAATEANAAAEGEGAGAAEQGEAPSAAPRTPGEESVGTELEAIFAEFERIDEGIEEASLERKRKSRPADRRIEQVVAALVRTLTSKRDVTEKDLDVVLEITKNKIVEAVNAQAITIYFLEPDGIHFRHVSYARSLYRGDPNAEKRFQRALERLKSTVLPPGTGIVGRVIARNEAHVTLDASRDPAHYEEIEKQTGFHVKSMITVPIAHEGEVYGAIQCLNKNPASGEEFFSQRDLRLVEEVADYSARVIYMARHPGFVWSQEDVSRYVARLAKLEYIDLGEVEIDPKLLALVGEENLRKFEILPLKKLGSGSLKAAIDNPLDVNRRDAFELATGLEVEVLVVSPAEQIRKAIEAAFAKRDLKGAAEALGAELAEKASKVEKIELEDGAEKDSAPVIQLANRIIEDAYSRGASDIHVEPFESDVVVRYRVDGVLEEKLRLPPAAIRPLVARLKIMANLNIAETRLPQDGRILFKDFTKTDIDVDIRVATAPMIWGEKVVMRLLDRKAAAIGLDALGLSPRNLEIYRKCLAAPYGMILHVGPTGSGKTTTLYAALRELNTPDVNIQTAEDPVEYVLPGVNQMQIRPQIGLDFARALRSYLRQDPDIILVGEIRDLETAEIAIEAALTGHQLLSTMHTNDAAGTVTRFVDMGIEPFLVSSSLLCVCAQRLMRRLCACKIEHDPTPEERELIGLEAGERPSIFAAKPGGCPKCNGIGYKGRIGVHELLVMNDELREATARRGVPTSEIDRIARKAGMVPLCDDAMAKVKQGITSVEEALRTVRVEKF